MVIKTSVKGIRNIGLALIILSIIFGVCMLGQTQSFDCNLKTTWQYGGTNTSTLFLLYHSSSHSDTLKFEAQKPIMSAPAISGEKTITLRIYPYEPNYFAARYCIVNAGGDTLFGEWGQVKFQHKFNAPKFQIEWIK